MRNVIVPLVLFLLFSCSEKISKPYYNIKGNSNVHLNLVDYDLKGKSAVSGFIYLKRSKTFAEEATIKIAEKEYKTDSNGYFKINLEPGEYNLSAQYKNSIGETLKLKLSSDQHTIISFELGARGLNGRVY